MRRRSRHKDPTPVCGSWHGRERTKSKTRAEHEQTKEQKTRKKKRAGVFNEMGKCRNPLGTLRGGNWRREKINKDVSILLIPVFLLLGLHRETLTIQIRSDDYSCHWGLIHTKWCPSYIPGTAVYMKQWVVRKGRNLIPYTKRKRSHTRHRRVGVENKPRVTSCIRVHMYTYS